MLGRQRGAVELLQAGEWWSGSGRLEGWPGCCVKGEWACHRGRKASFLATTTLTLSDAAVGLFLGRESWLAKPSGTIPLPFAGSFPVQRPWSQARLCDPVPNT